MFIIAGLGNPGPNYAATRHNAGFLAVDKLAIAAGITVNKLKFKSLYGEGHMDGCKIILLKPQTYMNLSGEAVRDFVNFYKINPAKELLLLYDDISLPLSHIRIREKGSAGGHNGVENIIYQLETDTFLRVKIGIGQKPSYMALEDFVLSKFTEQEKNDLQRGISHAAEAAQSILTGDVLAVMNRFNQKAKEEDK